MAHIHVLVYSSEPGGSAKIWARNEDNGRVCYGALPGSSSALKLKRREETVQAMVRLGWVKLLCIADESFGVVGDFLMREIVGGVSRGLMGMESNPCDPMENPMEAMMGRFVLKSGIDLAKLRFTPTSTLREPRIMIRSLSAFNDCAASFNDDDTFLGCVPVQQIATAVTTVDARWDF